MKYPTTCHIIFCDTLTHYRPQTEFAKVMVLHMSVCPQKGKTWAGTPPRTRQVHPSPKDQAGTPHRTRQRHSLEQASTSPLGPGRYPYPRARCPPEQCMLGDKGNKRAVRILLECILV